jgi:hypothetical protein
VLLVALVAVLLTASFAIVPGGPLRAEATIDYADSHFAGMSADGRYVLFDSSAANLSPGAVDRHSDVYLRDRRSGTTT